jgi:hypothetical protein
VFSNEQDGFGDYNQKVFDAFDDLESGTKKRVAIQYKAVPTPITD